MAHPRRTPSIPVDLPAPHTVVWQVTAACAVQCRFCAISAGPEPGPGELTTQEGLDLLDHISLFGPSTVVFSGGDPFMRRDIFALLAYAREAGLKPSLALAVTALATSDRLARARDAGVREVSLSLDGAFPETHDSLRGMPDSFGRTLEVIGAAHALGLTVHVNTCVSQANVWELPYIAHLLSRLGATRWNLFFLVPVGRATADEVISPEEHESVLRWLVDLAQNAPFAIRVAMAPHVRRVAAQTGRPPAADALALVHNDADVCFITHQGDVQPSAFLPIAVGNVRRHSLTDLYRASALFRSLQDPSALKGKCGLCTFNTLCGGSRARAYAVSGDYMQADPSCSYVPPGWRGNARIRIERPGRGSARTARPSVQVDPVRAQGQGAHR